MRLEYDQANNYIEHTDRYWRTLAYIFLEDGALLNDLDLPDITDVVEREATPPFGGLTNKAGTTAAEHVWPQYPPCITMVCAGMKNKQLPTFPQGDRSTE
jgi:hypothetical protein